MSNVAERVGNQVWFYCPGCRTQHAVRVNDSHTNVAGCWGWNGSLDRPTFTPSVLCNASEPLLRCHSFVKDGQIQYLSDCAHEFKGKTIPLPEFEGWNHD